MIISRFLLRGVLAALALLLCCGNIYGQVYGGHVSSGLGVPGFTTVGNSTLNNFRGYSTGIRPRSHQRSTDNPLTHYGQSRVGGQVSQMSAQNRLGGPMDLRINSRQRPGQLAASTTGITATGASLNPGGAGPFARQMRLGGLRRVANYGNPFAVHPSRLWGQNAAKGYVPLAGLGLREMRPLDDGSRSTLTARESRLDSQRSMLEGGLLASP